MRERAKQLTNILRKRDYKLYAEVVDGMIKIFRESYRFLPFSFEGNTLMVSVPSPHRVLCLTDNWVESGKPVDWGVEPLMQRFNEIDSWARASFAREREQYLEKQEQEKDRRIKNMSEDLAKELRKPVADYFSEFNTASI